MTVITRFAPSPTGHIHIGNARTALANWLFAQKYGGRFILRFDDTDVERSKREYAVGIERDLEWLGIHPDKLYRQSERFHLYQAAAEQLKAAGLLYPCYESADELERRRRLRLARKLPPVYGREALAHSAGDRVRFEAEGRRAHWRFLLPNYEADPREPRRTEIHWDDLVRGRQTVDLSSLSDPVLIREDGTWLYTMPSVVDDIEMSVTHVIRGEDHVTNTGAQIALFRALGAEPPVFGHHNLLTTSSGEGLSKRTGALSIGALAKEGFEPMAVASLAVLTGTSDNVEPIPSLAELGAAFDLSHVSKSAAKFDPAELGALNRKLIHHLDFSDVKGRLQALGIEGEKAQAFWNAVRGNLEKFGEVSVWWPIISEGPDRSETLPAEDLDFVREAFDLLPDGPFDDQIWKLWIGRVKAESGRKGRDLFMPLRIALTGRSSGPELAELLPLFGREGTLARRP